MLRAVIIDDEPAGANALDLMIKKITLDLKVVAIARDPEKGIELIEDYKPDVVFLDINMPRINGFELLERLRFRDFKLVFTTAHDSYAIQAIRSRAVDYLIKPIDAAELGLCINNILQSFGKKWLEIKQSYGSVIELSVRNGIIFIKTSEIIRLEADRSYTIFYLLNNIKHIASKSLGLYEIFLDPAIFYRSHTSHIINLKMVSRLVSDNGLFIQMIDGSLPDLVKKNKPEFLERLKNL